MKWLGLLILSLSLQTFAARVDVQGSGWANGYCSGDHGAFFCKSNIENQAQGHADYNAGVNCRLQNGNLVYYTRSCSTYCNPPYIPAGQSMFVSCQASCRYACETRD